MWGGGCIPKAIMCTLGWSNNDCSIGGPCIAPGNINSQFYSVHIKVHEIQLLTY